MIYLVSTKYFKKRVTELIGENDYFLIDGENYGVTGRDANMTSEAYGCCHNLGGFCPETELYQILRRMCRGIKYNSDKAEKLTKQFLKSKDLKAAIVAAIKAQCTFDNDINVIIILPGVVMKALGKELAKKIQKTIDVDFDFVCLDHDLPKKKKKVSKQMEHGLKHKQLKKIYKQIKQVEKKLKVRIEQDEEDERSWVRGKRY